MPDIGELDEIHKQEWLRAYLDEAELTPIKAGKYEHALRSFAFMHTPGCRFPSETPLLCGLPPEICRELFILQHLPFRDKVTKDTFAERRTMRYYDFDKNRQMLETLKRGPADPYRQILIEWAERQSPVKVPVWLWEVTETTLRKTRGLMRFLGIGSRVMGIGEPYRDFYTVYRTVNVFENVDEARCD